MVLMALRDYDGRLGNPEDRARVKDVWLLNCIGDNVGHVDRINKEDQDL